MDMTPGERARDLADREYWSPVDAWHREIAAVEKAIREAEEATALRERERCARIAGEIAHRLAYEESRDGCIVAQEIETAIHAGAPAKPAPAWSKEPPTVPGVYYHRTEWEPEPVLRRICRGRVETSGFYAEGLEGLFLGCASGGEWFGPLEIPQ